jgi:glucose/arabinose dehydrogenase
MKKIILLLSFIFTPSSVWAAESQLKNLTLPTGFSIEVFAKAPNARSLALGPDGFVFVGTRSDGRVYALAPDRNGDRRSDRVYTLASDLHMPNGVAYKHGDLYVAEVSRIRVFRDIIKNLESPGPGELWGPTFPSEEHHGWKYIAFGPDGWLYVPVGAPCNICLQNPDLYAAIHRISPDGKSRELVAKGVRNSVGFDWHPATKQLWFTDNGRDFLGDEKPPCELNRVTRMGEHFGYPHCHGQDILDPEFQLRSRCEGFTPPEHGFPAHSAPLGMHFIRKVPGLEDSLLVAEHGSWNRSSPIGYQVSRLSLKDGKIQTVTPFVRGFLKNGKAWGRPVDLLEMPDGSLLLSDDFSGTVYRIRGTSKTSATRNLPGGGN